MVRGNWQKRVETAEARRREAKESKQKKEDKKVFKGYVHAFLKKLDEHHDVIRRRKRTLHIWTDTLPLSVPPLLDLLEEQNKNHRGGGAGGSPNKRGGGGRGRAPSLDETDDDNNNGGRRGGGQGRRPGDRKKKVHPRSKEAEATEESSSTAAPTTPLMSRRDFLYGKSDRGGKKGKYFLSTSEGKRCTLASLKLRVPGSDRAEKDQKALLREVEEAIVKVTPEDVSSNDPEAMEMLYYSAINCESESEATGGTSLSEDILANLSEMQAPLATIVYIAVDDVLCFDRNRDGMLSNVFDSFVNDLVLSTRRPRQASVDSETGEDNSKEVNPTQLPGAVLEHMLTFLPDAAVAACCKVCRSWNREIGQHSPNLWLHLLRRHNWPEVVTLATANPEEDDEEKPAANDDEKCASLRRLFQNHYVAVRDIQALASAVPSITRQSTQTVLVEDEVTYQAFGSRKHTPHETDTCVALEEWSPSHVLAGFSNECCIRLFQAVHFRGKEKRCKELVCQSVDPYRLTRKRTCTLDAVGLDEEMIGCLCHVSASKLDDDVAAFILVLLTRDNFLMGESSAVAAKGGVADTLSEDLRVIDVGEAVLNFILSSDVEDDRLVPLFEYLKHQGEVGDVCTTVSRRRIVAVGHQRFMLEVSISIPQEPEDGDEAGGEQSLLQLDRKLVLISAARGAIDWMGDSFPSPLSPPTASINATLGSLRWARLPGGTRGNCSLAVAAPHAAAVSLCEIQPSGLVSGPRLVEGSDAVRSSWVGFIDELQAHSSESLLVSQTHVITIDSVYQTNEDDAVTMVRSKVSFFERDPENEPRTSTMTISGEVRLHDIVFLRDDYVVAIGVEFPGASEATEEENTNPGLNVDSGRLIMIVIHVPTEQEIARIGLTPPIGDEYNAVKPHFMPSANGGTIAMAIGGLGIAMSGDDIRSLGASTDSAPSDMEDSPKKKKKQARGKKGSKKDGFARGMSLRG